MTVQDRTGGSVVEFDAPVFGLERLGTIVENDLVRDRVWAAISEAGTCGVFPSTRLLDIGQDEQQAWVELDNGKSISSQLLIGCDGGTSRVRCCIGEDTDIWDYNQKGLVSLVRKYESNPGVAWQRFMESGPLAFLPLSDGRSSIVWTLPAAEADRLVSTTKEVFIQELDAASKGWLGATMECGQRAAFPLIMRLSQKMVSGRVVLLGDAAHVVHPLAGQGVNLGLADAASLVETLADNRLEGRSIADPASLAAFERWRKSESGVMAGGIHAVGALFRPEFFSPLRALGMNMVSKSWFAREAFVKRAAGQGPNAPRLSTGADLHSLLRP